MRGQRDPRKLAALADRRLKASPKALYDALHGRLTESHRFLISLHLEQYDALAGAIARIDAQVEESVARIEQEPPGQAGFRSLIDLLVDVPGLSRLSALTILSEIGADMSHFASASHLVAWAGLSAR